MKHEAQYKLCDCMHYISKNDTLLERKHSLCKGQGSSLTKPATHISKRVIQTNRTHGPGQLKPLKYSNHFHYPQPSRGTKKPPTFPPPEKNPTKKKPKQKPTIPWGPWHATDFTHHWGEILVITSNPLDTDQGRQLGKLWLNLSPKYIFYRY